MSLVDRLDATAHSLLTGVGIRDHHGPPFEFLEDLGVSVFVLPGWAAATGGPVTLIADRLYYIPIWLPRSKTFDRIGIHVTTAVGGSVIRLGIYAADFNADDELVPGALTLDAGTVSSATTGEKLITITETLAQGYHFLSQSSGDGPAVQGFSASGVATVPVSGHGSAVQNALGPMFEVDIADGSAALNDPATAPDNIADGRFASVRLRG